MGAAARQKSFPTPEEGVQALIEAAQRHDTTTLLAILGPEAKSLLSTGDPSPIGKAVSISSSFTKRHIRWCSRGTRRWCCRSGKTVAFPHPAHQGQRRLALRHAGGQGRDPQAAHRTQRARRHPGVPGLCRRATRILRAQSPERYATAVCAQVHQHEGQTRRTVLGNIGQRAAEPMGSPRGPEPDARATSVPPASLCPITATITKCLPGKDPTRRVAPMTIWCVAR